jgi:putative SOS response-associated peptidase YedK
VVLRPVGPARETGPSAGLLGDYHDRAPMVLDPQDWGVWLDPAQDATGLLGAG